MLRDKQIWATIFKVKSFVRVTESSNHVCDTHIFILIRSEIVTVKKGQLKICFQKFSHTVRKVSQETHLKKVLYGTMRVKITSQREKNKRSGLM